MTAAGHFRYHDLGEMDTELKGLSVRTGTIRARDTLGAADAERHSISALTSCHAVLDDFAACVCNDSAIT